MCLVRNFVFLYAAVLLECSQCFKDPLFIFMLIQSDDDKRTGNFVNRVGNSHKIDPLALSDTLQSVVLIGAGNIIFVDTDIGFPDFYFQSIGGGKRSGVKRTHGIDFDAVSVEVVDKIHRPQVVVIRTK